MALAHLPYEGHFSLDQQQAAKQQMMHDLPHTWFVHQDADELLEHRSHFVSLRACIEEAHAQGFNALNFEEFVFLPSPVCDLETAGAQGNHYLHHLRYYYYYCPRPNRLNRAFARHLAGANASHGGHVLQSSELRLSPTSHVLRHYIGLSEAHLQRKYGQRRFCPEEIARGWHKSRLALSPDQLQIPSTSPLLRQLPGPAQGCWDRSCPATSYFWLWRQPSETA